MKSEDQTGGELLGSFQGVHLFCKDVGWEPAGGRDHRADQPRDPGRGGDIARRMATNGAEVNDVMSWFGRVPRKMDVSHPFCVSSLDQIWVGFGERAEGFGVVLHKSS